MGPCELCPKTSTSSSSAPAPAGLRRRSPDTTRGHRLRSSKSALPRAATRRCPRARSPAPARAISARPASRTARRSLIADLMRIAGETDCPELVQRLAEQSAPTVEWLVDCVGARLSLVTAYKHVGHSVARLHAPTSRRGQDLVDDLLAGVARRAIPLAVGNGVDQLIVDGGAVVGARLKTASGESSTIRGRQNHSRRQRLCRKSGAGSPLLPGNRGRALFRRLGSTGEAVLWGEALGAALVKYRRLPRLCRGR